MKWTIKAKEKYYNEFEYYKQGHIDKDRMLELAMNYIEELEENEEFITEMLEEERYSG
ncbi:hypothetical protein CF5_0163 [Staphylococcus phage CF5]|uniref:Phage protein n=1 Tax=Staphylococcus phage CF5 TaxID=3113739 RepID=A0AAX4J784_9CAUD|nr:hypothetical protein CF5_0163 [Staphylococcus phage CF5]